MLWEMFSVSIASENQERIPVHNYEIREGSYKSFDSPLEEQDVVIHLDSPLSPGLYALRTLYVAVIRKDLMGCYLSYENGQPFVMTQFEPNFARTFLPTFDEPNIKMIFEMSIISPSNLIILFNTPPRSSSPILLESRSGTLLSYKQTLFEPTPPMSAYLLAVGIGPFQEIHQTTRYGVKLSVHFPLCGRFPIFFIDRGESPRFPVRSGRFSARSGVFPIEHRGTVSPVPFTNPFGP